MAHSSSDGYAPQYFWDWLRRDAWRPTFRTWKRHSSVAFAELLRLRGFAREPVLDCSCGLGLKTIIMHELGLNVSGSDRCTYAIEHARELAAREDYPSLPFYVATWENLSHSAPQHYAGIFNDALCWSHDERDMAASLRGLHDALRPGGLLAYMGALPGTDTNQNEVLEQEWCSRTANGTTFPGFHFFNSAITADETIQLEKGADYIDERHTVVVTEACQQRQESWTLRHVIKWNWPQMERLLRDAGFLSFAAHSFQAAQGRQYHLVVAERD